MSMHADDALTGDAAAMTLQHLDACQICQAKYAAPSDEISMIASALSTDLPEPADLVIPKFSRRTNLREFALANIATALVIWFAQFLWKTLFGELFMNAATWLTSIYMPDIYEMTSATILYYLKEGTAMFDAYLGFIVLALSSVVVLWLLLVYWKSRAVMSLCLLVMLGTTLGVPAPVMALEVMRSEGLITIGEEETIDDSLVIAADTILIKGNITGDLVAAGRRIDIDGSVEGNVLISGISHGERHSRGLLLGAGSSFDVVGAKVGVIYWQRVNA
ncbi:MAG: hypothetical protein VB957_06280 [Pseudomonadales bacterium]